LISPFGSRKKLAAEGKVAAHGWFLLLFFYLSLIFAAASVVDRRRVTLSATICEALTATETAPQAPHY
jgi:hypothetical protein